VQIESSAPDFQPTSSYPFCQLSLLIRAELQTKASQTRIKMMSAMISAPMTARPVAPVAARPQRSSLVVRASGSRQVRNTSGTRRSCGFSTVSA